ncbi:hypothetical protein [Microvirga lenta]|uniref:hypothetical protein n=1 Tax=Microvirga lenta TaxID=2881337 RepID=UPI001CFFADD8|nr:hypothetical protein [Microvirga lenta]MCB5176420.1 hypothetical protein [Microvirga lenta]
MPGPDLVDRLKAASDHDEGIPAADAQALFLEAAEMIEMLRSLLEPVTDGGLEDLEPKGRA